MDEDLLGLAFKIYGTVAAIIITVIVVVAYLIGRHFA